MSILSSIFFLMIRLPPRATPFPYTTLFRSHLRIIRKNSSKVKAYVFGTETQVHTALPDNAARLDHMVGEVLGSRVQVFIVEPDESSFLQSVIRLGSGAGINLDGVHRTLRRRFFERMNQPVSRSEQHNQHKDSPCHGDRKSTRLNSSH